MPCILHDDNAYLVVSKQPNQLVYKSYYSRNIKSIPLLNELEQILAYKLYPIHRLDYKTSGLLLFAKSSESAKELQQTFEKREVTKTYLALVRGFFNPSDGSIDSPVKHPETGKYRDAETAYQTLLQIQLPFPVKPYDSSRYSLMILKPKTGRMHQLRKHMNKVAHPIIGDHKYGNRHHNQFFENHWKCPYLLLHAYSLNLQMNEKELDLTVPVSNAWSELLEKLIRHGEIIYQAEDYERLAKLNKWPVLNH